MQLMNLVSFTADLPCGTVQNKQTNKRPGESPACQGKEIRRGTNSKSLRNRILVVVGEGKPVFIFFALLKFELVLLLDLRIVT